LLGFQVVSHRDVNSFGAPLSMTRVIDPVHAADPPAPLDELPLAAVLEVVVVVVLVVTLPLELDACAAEPLVAEPPPPLLDATTVVPPQAARVAKEKHARRSRCRMFRRYTLARPYDQTPVSS
jgi:hypothetical protein